MTYSRGPTEVIGKYKLVKLEMPPYDDNAFQCIGSKDCADPKLTDFSNSEVIVAVVADLKKKAPGPVEFLSKMQIPNDTINSVLAWGDTAWRIRSWRPAGAGPQAPMPSSASSSAPVRAGWPCRYSAVICPPRLKIRCASRQRRSGQPRPGRLCASATASLAAWPAIRTLKACRRRRSAIWNSSIPSLRSSISFREAGATPLLVIEVRFGSGRSCEVGGSSSFARTRADLS